MRTVKVNVLTFISLDLAIFSTVNVLLLIFVKLNVNIVIINVLTFLECINILGNYLLNIFKVNNLRYASIYVNNSK